MFTAGGDDAGEMDLRLREQIDDKEGRIDDKPKKIDDKLNKNGRHNFVAAISSFVTISVHPRL